MRPACARALLYMKRFWQIFLSGLLALFASCPALAAQDEAGFIVSGKKAGTVPFEQIGGVPYVDTQKTARKFGASVELFAKSKQAKVSTKGFYAILTAPLQEIVVNAQAKTLSAPVLVRGGKIMTPAEFFTLPAFTQAVDKLVEFKDGAFYVERRYNLSYEEKKFGGKDNLLVFSARKNVTFTTEQPNKHTVIITFPNAVVKRDLHERLRTSYIASADIRQNRGDAVLKIILGKDARVWSFDWAGDKLVFRAGLKNALPAPEETAGTEPVQPAPAPAKAAHKSLVEGEEPSVLSETETLSYEPVMTAAAPKAAVLSPANPEHKQAPAISKTAPKPAPILKSEPNPVSMREARKKMRVVVDPGHGGKDPGAIRNRMREKDWNLSVGKELARLLQKGGFEVKLTRDNDTFIALSERSKIANNFKADLFVSVHTNASKNRNANGFQVYFRSEKATDKEAAETAAFENEAMQYEEVHYNFVDALLQSLAKNEYINESSKLAGYVRNAVYKQPGIGIAVNQNSSVRQANFYVLKGVNSPAVLVEMGYISSNKDRARLSNSAVRNKMALGIYNGIYNYAKKEGWIN